MAQTKIQGCITRITNCKARIEKSRHGSEFAPTQYKRIMFFNEMMQDQEKLQELIDELEKLK